MSAASAAGDSLGSVILVLQILSAASLKLLWAMINTLQFVVFFTEWQVIIPTNAEYAIGFARSVALGEFVPTDTVTDPMAEPFETV